jgi:hypothetical protein
MQFYNTSNSKCRFKLTIDDDPAELLTTDGIVFDHGYIEQPKGRIEYRIPTSFNGEFGFIFNESELKRLTIATFVKEMGD